MQEGAGSTFTALLQDTLNKLGIPDGEGNALRIDGIYGPKTRAAYTRFVDEYGEAETERPTAGWADRIKGAVPSTTVLSPLQTRLTGIGTLTNKRGKQMLINPAHTRLWMIDQHTNKLGIPQGPPHINMDIRGGEPKLYQAAARAFNHKEVPVPVYEALHDFTRVKNVVKTGGKALAAAGAALDAYQLGHTLYDDLHDEDGRLGKKTGVTATGIGLSWAGAYVGGKLGAIGCSAIGTMLLPGLGTVIGGFLGGIGGGIAGAMGGREAGRRIAEENMQGE
jgi:peptidoglycan hydrolase-like protein with peptidoglycan-binding domain